MLNSVNVKLFGETPGLRNCKEGAGKGIQFLVNGWTLSAQAGWGNYCTSDPTRAPMFEQGMKLERHTVRTDCEIALWQQKDHKMIELDEDSVMGWVEWGKVLEIVHWLTRLDHQPTEVEVHDFVLHVTRR